VSNEPRTPTAAVQKHLAYSYANDIAEAVRALLMVLPSVDFEINFGPGAVCVNLSAAGLTEQVHMTSTEIASIPRLVLAALHKAILAGAMSEKRSADVDPEFLEDVLKAAIIDHSDREVWFGAKGDEVYAGCSEAKAAYVEPVVLDADYYGLRDALLFAIAREMFYLSQELPAAT